MQRHMPKPFCLTMRQICWAFDALCGSLRVLQIEKKQQTHEGRGKTLEFYPDPAQNNRQKA